MSESIPQSGALLSVPTQNTYGSLSRFVLNEFQSDAVDDLVKFFESRASISDKYEVFALLEAVMASGKTTIATVVAAYMAAKYDIAVLWLSPSAGGLPEQSAASLRKITESVPVHSASNGAALPGGFLSGGSISVAGWSKLNASNSRIMLEGEKANDFLSRVRSLRTSKKNLLVVIDESHNSAKTGEKTLGVLEDITNALGHAPMVLEMTATPHPLSVPKAHEKNSTHIRVETPRVVESGAIRHSILVNDDIYSATVASNPTASSVAHVVLSGIERIATLDLGYKQACSRVANACGIAYIPNGEAGEDIKREILDILDKRGYTVSNGKVAIWLSGEKTHSNLIADINDPDSPVKVIITKTALAEGVDCPRVQVIMGFRASGSIIFGAQSVGRAIRTIGRRHFGNSLLDSAYIYTNLDESMFDFSGAGAFGSLFKDKPVFIDSDVTLPSLPVSKWGRFGLEQGDIDAATLAKAIQCRKAAKALGKVAPTLSGLFANTEPFKMPVMSEVRVDTAAVYMTGTERSEQVESGQGSSVPSGSTLEVAASRDWLLKRLAKRLGSDKMLPEPYTNVSRTAEKLSKQLHDWVEMNCPEVAALPKSARILVSLTMFERHEEIRKAWQVVLNECPKVDTRTIEPRLQPWEAYEFTRSFSFSSEKDAQVPLRLSDSCLYRDSDDVAWVKSGQSLPEKRFTKEVLSVFAKKYGMEWWWKNGDDGAADKTAYFRLPMLNKEDGHMYPDYLGRLLLPFPIVFVLENKGEGGEISYKSSDSRKKAETLGRWAVEHAGPNVLAGLVYFREDIGDWMFANTADVEDDILLWDAIQNLIDGGLVAA